MQYWLLVFLLVFAKPSEDYIRIDHIGESDKPIKSIIITKKLVDTDLPTLDRLENVYHILTEKTYEKIYKITKSEFHEKRCGGNYGTFEVIIKNDNSVTKFCLTREHAIRYFTKISSDPAMPDALKADYKNNNDHISY